MQLNGNYLLRLHAEFRVNSFRIVGVDNRAARTRVCCIWISIVVPRGRAAKKSVADLAIVKVHVLNRSSTR